MSQELLIAGIVAAAVASAGLWWFRLVLPVVRRQPQTTRFVIYGLIWLAYFVLTMIVIGRSGV